MVDVTQDVTITSPREWRSLTTIVSDFRAAFSTRLEKHRIYTRTLAELEGYSRRELLDMGISRDEIRDLARQAAGL